MTSLKGSFNENYEQHQSDDSLIIIESDSTSQIESISTISLKSEKSLKSNDVALKQEQDALDKTQMLPKLNQMQNESQQTIANVEIKTLDELEIKIQNGIEERIEKSQQNSENRLLQKIEELEKKFEAKMLSKECLCTKTNEPERFAVHNSIICDHCESSPIIGNRFKCLQCPDYDLCMNCEPKEHKEHLMLRISEPSNFRDIKKILDLNRISSLQEFKFDSGNAIPKFGLISNLINLIQKECADKNRNHHKKEEQSFNCYQNLETHCQFTEINSQDKLGAKSQKYDCSIDVKFTNLSKIALDYYWLDYKGKKVFYKNLQPNSSYVQQTFVTHPWLIFSSQDLDVPLAHFVPTDDLNNKQNITVTTIEDTLTRVTYDQSTEQFSRSTNTMNLPKLSLSTSTPNLSQKKVIEIVVPNMSNMFDLSDEIFQKDEKQEKKDEKRKEKKQRQLELRKKIYSGQRISLKNQRKEKMQKPTMLEEEKAAKIIKDIWKRGRLFVSEKKQMENELQKRNQEECHEIHQLYLRSQDEKFQQTKDEILQKANEEVKMTVESPNLGQTIMGEAEEDKEITKRQNENRLKLDREIRRRKLEYSKAQRDKQKKLRDEKVRKGTDYAEKQSCKEGTSKVSKKIEKEETQNEKKERLKRIKEQKMQAEAAHNEQQERIRRIIGQKMQAFFEAAKNEKQERLKRINEQIIQQKAENERKAEESENILREALRKEQEEIERQKITESEILIKIMESANNEMTATLSEMQAQDADWKLKEAEKLSRQSRKITELIAKKKKLKAMKTKRVRKVSTKDDIKIQINEGIEQYEYEKEQQDVSTNDLVAKARVKYQHTDETCEDYHEYQSEKLQQLITLMEGFDLNFQKEIHVHNPNSSVGELIDLISPVG